MPIAQTALRTVEFEAATMRFSCAHGRMIDDVLTAEGTKTGMVRCLECLEVIPDPHLRKAIG
jgi:hypothetical protein